MGSAVSIDSETKPRDHRNGHLKHAKRLAIFTIVWNVVEAACAIVFGVLANSVSLTSFGIDAAIETISAGVMYWRLNAEEKSGGPDATEHHERRASRILGALLLLLCVYICVDSGTTLAGMQPKEESSWPGVVLTVLGLIVTPFLAHAKLKCSKHLDSNAQRADAIQSATSCWLGFTTLFGLLANALLGWTWADPIAALLFIPLIMKEAITAIRSS